MVESGSEGFKSQESGLPPGWSLRYNNFKNFLKAPNGRVFQGKINAIRYMEEERYPEAHIEKMIETLALDGWKFDDNLPTGWMFRRREGSKYHFLTDDMQTIEGSTKAHETMTIEQNQDVLAKFALFLKFQSRKPTGVVRPSRPEQKSPKTMPKTPFISATSDNVPTDWIVGKLEDGRQKVVCPDGSQHATRREALKYMVDKGFPEKDINSMRSFLKVEGWEDNEKLPPNWKYKTKADKRGTRKYLMAANGRIYDTIATAVKHMEASQWYSQAEISQVQSIANIPGEKNCKSDQHYSRNCCFFHLEVK